MNSLHRFSHSVRHLAHGLAIVLALAATSHLALAASPMIETADPNPVTTSAADSAQGRDRPGDTAWLALAGVLAIIFIARRRRD